LALNKSKKCQLLYKKNKVRNFTWRNVPIDDLEECDIYFRVQDRNRDIFEDAKISGHHVARETLEDILGKKQLTEKIKEEMYIPCFSPTCFTKEEGKECLVEHPSDGVFATSDLDYALGYGNRGKMKLVIFVGDSNPDVLPEDEADFVVPIKTLMKCVT